MGTNSTDFLQKQVLEGLLKPEGTKEIPCSLLYDDRGSQLYEEITLLEEYYPFRAEETLLQQHAQDIATHIPGDSVVVELGCGTARKSGILLSAVQALHGRCKYVGIDVSASFLQEARANLLQEVEGIAPESLEMVEAEYMEGLKKARELHPSENLCIMWLGSTVGNFSNDGAIQFFRDILDAVGTRCQIFLCADMWKDKGKLYAAYHDSKGITELFIKNGMRCGLALLDHNTTSAEEDSWVYEVIINDKLRRVEMYLKFSEELILLHQNIHVRSGERVLVEVSRKFSVGDFNQLANQSGLHIDVAWRDNVWGMQMQIPFGEALERCWMQTDLFFQNIEDWCQKPIDVRHPFKFYYGHIQAFAKLKLMPNDPPSPTEILFSRGIDPNLLDPSKCHSHPEVPSEWPARSEIEAFAHKTRAKVLKALAAGEVSPRIVVLALEHEYMHIETLAYMQVQDRKATFEKKMSGGGIPHQAAGVANGGMLRTGMTNSIGVPKYVANGHANGSLNGSSNGEVAGVTNGAKLRTGMINSNSVSNGHADGSSNGSSNGKVAGVTNGEILRTGVINSNGVSNGHANGSSNGSSNGKVAGVTNGEILRTGVISSNGVSNGHANGAANGASNGVFNGVTKKYVNGATKESDGVTTAAPNGVTRSYSNGGINGGLNGSTRNCSNGVTDDTRDGITKMHRNGSINSAPLPVSGACKKYSCTFNNMVYIAPGDVTLGGNASDGGFMWDNEYPEFTASVTKSLWVGCKSITVGEFLTFIQAGGYESENLWDPLDFSLFHQRKSAAPATWSKVNGEYFVHTPSSTEHWTRMADQPVFVSLSEAQAFCTWVGGRVMTEPEYHLTLMSDKAPKVKKLRTGGWEWTSSPFQPFPGFAKMPEYPEYSSDFFDGSHYVLKGASPVTHPCMRRDTFRNFYQRQYPFMFAKFRVCKDELSSVPHGSS